MRWGFLGINCMTLRVGDIVSVGYIKNKHEYHHSAVVYAVYGDEQTVLYDIYLL